jgi:hypothetical protein
MSFDGRIGTAFHRTLQSSWDEVARGDGGRDREDASPI